MASGDTRYQARFEFPDLLERERDNVIRCPVYLSGNLVAPTTGSPGSVTVFDSDGASRATPSVSIVNQVATATVTAASLPSTIGFNQNWRIEWELNFDDDAVASTFRQEAALVRNQLYPVVTGADLLRHHPDLKDLRPSDRPSFQPEIDEAWADIQNLLWEQGNRPNLIVSPASLRAANKWLALSIVFEGMADGPAGTDETFQARADKYRARFEKSWETMTFRYDSDEDGTPDLTEHRTGTRGTVFLKDRTASAGGGWWRW